MLVFGMLSLLCVVNNDIFKSVCFYVYTNARPPGGPCPPPRHPRAAPRYVPATRHVTPHISCITCNAAHNVTYAWEVIVNHGECRVAMSAWVMGRCEIGDDRRHIPSSNWQLKNHHTPHRQWSRLNSPTLGKIASHTCTTSRKKKCYTLFAWESLAWFFSPHCNFCQKTHLTTPLVPLRLLTLELVKVLTTLGVLENELRNSDHWNRHEGRSHSGNWASRRRCTLVPPWPRRQGALFWLGSARMAGLLKFPNIGENPQPQGNHNMSPELIAFNIFVIGIGIAFTILGFVANPIFWNHNHKETRSWPQLFSQ